MDKKEMKQQIVDTVKEYAEGNYHLDITEHDLHIAADRIVKLFSIPVVSGLLPSEKLNEEWEACKKALDLKGTAGEMGTYFGMFMHGWRGRNTEGFWQ